MIAWRNYPGMRYSCARLKTYPTHRDMYRRRLLIVELAIKKPMTPIAIEPVVCQKRSLAVSERLWKTLKKPRTTKKWHKMHLVTKNIVNTFSICGGTQSKRVIDGPYPRVATTVGKNITNDCEISRSMNAIANHHTVKSVKASTRPDTWLVSSELSVSLRCKSSFVLFCANSCSSAVSHDARVVG